MDSLEELMVGPTTANCGWMECTNIDCYYYSGTADVSPQAIPAKIEHCREPASFGGGIISSHCGCGRIA